MTRVLLQLSLRFRFVLLRSEIQLGFRGGCLLVVDILTIQLAALNVQLLGGVLQVVVLLLRVVDAHGD